MTQTFLKDPQWAKWIRDLEKSFMYRAQFILSGNLRDLVLTPTANGYMTQDLKSAISDLLGTRGVNVVVVYDRVDGLSLLLNSEGAREAEDASSSVYKWLKKHKILDNKSLPASKQKLSEIMQDIALDPSLPVGLIIDFASRLVLDPNNLSEEEQAFFLSCEKVAYRTEELRAGTDRGIMPYNPIFWLVDKENDLPGWFLIGKEVFQSLTVTLPDQGERETLVRSVSSLFADYSSMGTELVEERIRDFVGLTDGMMLRSILSIFKLARHQSIGLSHIANAVRCYKIGVPDSPWDEPKLKESIGSGREIIAERVKGQNHAVEKSLDILKRAILNLSGAQASSSGSRPKGVLFFAGPTGVGKTELAKAISELVFGDEQAYKRFDMSEFSAEQSEARLIGAPPGYIGYDAGGELVNSVRERPFSVLLFDEIEKAHSRILDKFLQILEDGRLTDGRGETVYFSEAVLIFTSNLGMFVNDENGNRVMNVDPERDNYSDVEEKVRRAIQDDFRYRLERPELLNRIGDNIVIFDFIREPVAELIFETMISNIIDRVKDTNGIELKLTDDAMSQLKHMCTSDLSDGGRGIGNKLETSFINPLSRALFDRKLSKNVVVRGIETGDNIHKVIIA